jgi:hypothetical protein
MIYITRQNEVHYLVHCEILVPPSFLVCLVSGS